MIKRTFTAKQRKYDCLIIGVILYIMTPLIGLADTQPSFLNNFQFLAEPELLIKQMYDDNLLSSETNTKSSWGSAFAPSLTLNLKKYEHAASINYALNKTIYSNSQEDEFLDQSLRSDLKIRFSRRTIMTLFASHTRGHEDRGTGFSQGSAEGLTEPDKTRQYRTGATITFGTEESLGRVKLMLNAFAYRLDDRPNVGKFANQNNYSGSLTFYYKIKPNTSLLVEAYQAKHLFNSLSNDESIDNQENRYYIGSSWNVTALTMGTIKVGMIKKEFDNQEKSSFIGLGWDVGINWSPVEDTLLQLNARSQTEETTGLSDYIKTTEISSHISHQWTPLVETTFTANVMKNEYQPTNKEQGLWSINLAINYQLRQWVKLSGSILHQERLSTILNQDFQRNTYAVSLLFTK